MSKYFPKRDTAWAIHLANKHVEEAIRTMAEIMRDTKQDGNVRLSAAKALVERAAGRPHQSVSVDNGDNRIIDAIEAVHILQEEFGEGGALAELPAKAEDEGSDGEGEG